MNLAIKRLQEERYDRNDLFNLLTNLGNNGDGITLSVFLLSQNRIFQAVWICSSGIVVYLAKRKPYGRAVFLNWKSSFQKVSSLIVRRSWKFKFC